jgi:hypothetical protein
VKRQSKQPHSKPAKKPWSPPQVEKLGNLHEIVLQSGKSGGTQDGQSGNFMS